MPLEQNSKAIWIITDETPAAAYDSGAKTPVDIGAHYHVSPEREPGEAVRGRTLVKAEQLKREMSEFLDAMQEVLEQAERPKSKMRLEEIEISIEINGEGQVSLLGTGGKVGGKGGMTLKFKRKDY